MKRSKKSAGFTAGPFERLRACIFGWLFEAINWWWPHVAADCVYVRHGHNSQLKQLKLPGTKRENNRNQINLNCISRAKWRRKWKQTSKKEFQCFRFVLGRCHNAGQIFFLSIMAAAAARSPNSICIFLYGICRVANNNAAASTK